jgi:hypothetical protein
VQVTAKVNADAFLRRLERAVQRAPTAPQMEGANRAAGSQYLGFIRKRFRSASAGDGTWVRLAPSTVRQKGGPTPILREDGRLYASLLPGNPECVFQPFPGGIRIGSRVPYAAAHQYGTATIPARPIFVSADADTLKRMRNAYSRAWQQAIEAGLKSK